jgi:hypothetical protein
MTPPRCVTRRPEPYGVFLLGWDTNTIRPGRHTSSGGTRRPHVIYRSVGFAVTPLCTSPARSPGTRTCAQLRSHVGRTLVPPSLTSGRATGLVAGWRQCTIYPVHAVTAQSLPPYGVLHRVGAVSQLPGFVRMLPAQCTRRETQTVSSSWTPPPTGRVLRCARTCTAQGTVHGSGLCGVCVPLDRSSISLNG